MCLSHSKCPFNRKLLSDTQLKCVLKLENNVPRVHMQLNVWSNFIGDCWEWLKNGRVGQWDRERSHDGKIQSHLNQTVPSRAVPNGTDTNSFRHVYFAAVRLTLVADTNTNAGDKHRAIEWEGEIKRFNQNAEEKMKNVYSLECSVTKKPNCIRKSQFQTKNLHRNAEQGKAKRREWARKKTMLGILSCKDTVFSCALPSPWTWFVGTHNRIVESEKKMKK